MNKLTKKLFFCFAAVILSLCISDSAVACIGSGAGFVDQDGRMVVSNCATPRPEIEEKEILTVVKKQESLNDMVDNNLISIVNQNIDFNIAKNNQTDKLNSTEKIAYNNSKYDLSKIIDNRSSSSITANNSQYRYSMLKPAYNSDIQPKDSAVRADKIAKDNNGDIMISSSYDKSVKVSSYYSEGGEITKL